MKIISISALGYIRVTPFEMSALLTMQTIHLKFLILIMAAPIRYFCKKKESILNFALGGILINKTLELRSVQPRILPGQTIGVRGFL